MIRVAICSAGSVYDSPMLSVNTPFNSHLIEVPVRGLRPGMFVVELDRPWLETPFAMQGFLIRDDSDVDYVAKHCDYVYIDPQRKVSPDKLPKRKGRARKPDKVPPPKRDKVPLKVEFDRVKDDFSSATNVMEGVFKRMRTHREVDLPSLRSAIDPLIDSVLRNREALAVLVRLKRKDDYLYNHSIATSVWAAILGRHLGMEKAALQQLALGTSIMDVGMSDVSRELLEKPSELSSEQLAQVKKHVAAGVKMVRESGEVSDKVLNIIACHHERHDGSGYPQGLAGNAIPAMARIAGLVDTYDAMLTPRPYSHPRSSFNAIQELVDSTDVLFQGSLVEHFVQAIGMFPTGCVVELNNGEVGVVITQNQTRRLRPKVVVILDREKRKHASMQVIDLAKYSEPDNGPSSLWIVKELEAGAYGINPDEYFL